MIKNRSCDLVKDFTSTLGYWALNLIMSKANCFEIEAVYMVAFTSVDLFDNKVNTLSST